MMAMALPLSLNDGSTFPGRDLILFHTFAVILVTLVMQRLSLPVIIRWLGVLDDGVTERENLQARIKAVEAGLGRLNENLDKASGQALAKLRTEFEDRIRQLELRAKAGMRLPVCC
jgi:CPA1 family monovalent cation:H+ antiporter